MGIEKQKNLTDGKGWKLIKDLVPSKKLKEKVIEKVKKISKPFIEESVAIKSLSKKDKD